MLPLDADPDVTVGRGSGEVARDGNADVCQHRHLDRSIGAGGARNGSVWSGCMATSDTVSMPRNCVNPGALRPDDEPGVVTL
jgi:hypothetical protein